MYDFEKLKSIASNVNTIFYDYRKASPKIPLIIFNRNDEEIRDLEEYFCSIKDVPKGDYVLFEIDVAEFSIACYFRDTEMIIGLGIIESNNSNPKECCPYCKGSGYITCKTCNGEGMIDEGIFGEDVCPDCDGGEVTCPHCFGSGDKR